MARKKGFSFVETMITAFLVSSLALGLSIYMKRAGIELRSSDQSENLRIQSQAAELALKNDIRQIVFINPSCDSNAPAERDIGASCSEIIIKAGVTPYPGESRQTINARFDLEISQNTSANRSDLNFLSDAVRLVLFDFSENYFCRLDSSTTANPSALQYSMQAAASCPEFQLGGLYVLMEEMGGRVFSNLFQITDLAGGSGSPYSISTAFDGLYNQSAPLGASGFSNQAKIFPVYLVEYAVGSEGGLYRREIRPTASDRNGFGQWTLVHSLVEALQFSFVTLPEDGPRNYLRTLHFSGSSLDRQLSDLRGLNAHLVLKSEKSHPKQTSSNNPLTEVIENDGYARHDSHFFINFRNAQFN